MALTLAQKTTSNKLKTFGSMARLGALKFDIKLTNKF